MTKLTAPVTLLLTAFLLCACGGKEHEPSPADNTKDRQLILTHWADDMIIPAYEDFQNVFNVMLSKADDFADSPSEATLSALRTAWVNAYTAWQRVGLYEFGPADRYTLRNFFNIYPADVSGITSNIGNPAVNLDLPTSYAQQGFPALDYLINGVASDDAAIVDYYTSVEDGADRLAYLKLITGRMDTLLTKVVSEWQSTYRDTFIAKTGLDISSSTGLVVNAYTLWYERYVRSGKIGIPAGAGVGTSGTAYPERVEAFYKRDISRSLAQAAHQAAADFFNGRGFDQTEGPSLKSYLDALGAKDATSGTMLSKIINDQLDTIETLVDQLSPDFYNQINSDNQPVIDTYAAMQKLVRLLKVDMSSAMSITITYTDNDGD